ncbi:VacJ family lipoprotein [Halomonas piscis]|uniref:VacJ family lipoprotein n=1 Tax=Halomonas piscis TaxID=3031727 RepID=A0ABY9YXN2_9GAMM|nr:VacJ family lipoprotein [Halomonas piscis]WNK19221.1 VacJ family lipoprotein [Halomonas piscis]
MPDNFRLTPAPGVKRAALLMPAVALTVVLGGCASSATKGEPHPEDPWEGFNRKVFVFNDVLDRYALRPVAKGYRTITPEPVEDSVGNFFSNLGEIRTVLNSLLQGKGENASRATSRLLINTTAGIGGLFDVATKMDIRQEKEDFGQTLATWGWTDSRYLVLPFLGPSTLRDATGLPADIATYPVTYVDDDKTRIALGALNLIDKRAGLLDQEDLIQGDRYRFMRDAYLQNRAFKISDGELGDDPFAADDFDFDDADFDDANVDDADSGDDNAAD